jgi:predicted nucleic acid-binding Zn ribbon protein
LSRPRLNRLGDLLNAALEKMEVSGAAYEGQAVVLWPDIVGPQMAQATEAERVQAGTLIVITRSSAWSQELAFQKQVIIRKYRERLGRPVVVDLRCRVGPVRGAKDPAAAALHPPPEEIRAVRLPEEELAQIQAATEGSDPELAEAVRRALTREAQHRRWHLEHGARRCPSCGSAYRGSGAHCPACRRER